MTKFLSSNQRIKINQWLDAVRTSPVVLLPLYSVIQEIYPEAPPNIRTLEVPTYNFKRANERRNYGKWKSEYLAKSSREKLRPEEPVVRAYCERLGLTVAFSPELNTVESMSSLPNPEANELVTESRSVLKSEFIRVLQIRNSFYAEQQLFTSLLSRQQSLSPEVTIFYEMRQSECAYGCEKAQQATQYIQFYAAAQRMDVDFAALFSALPYPEVLEEDGFFLSRSVSPSPGSNNVTSNMNMTTTMVSNVGKAAHLRKEAISDAGFENWRDRYVFTRLIG
ncbi:hypothetical protein AN958_11944 [Leucoagaricus sp. SymC.cos]|nr:hypothetical protein AN958_11944 [Leucoagaricus sp. SymC.cos]